MGKDKHKHRLTWPEALMAQFDDDDKDQNEDEEQHDDHD
jgi:hypothetical protein